MPLSPDAAAVANVGEQEQAPLQGQEGPQEEGPGSLHPQGLVLDQGAGSVQHPRVSRNRGVQELQAARNPDI